MSTTIRVTALISLLLAATGCPEDKPLSAPWSDDYKRAELGSNYLNTGGPYRIEGDKLQIKGAYNHPLWLKKKLPRDAVIEFDVTSRSSDGDIKVEIWGDGQSHATHKGSYMATSYVFIFGGWGNSKSIIARMDEHGSDVQVRTEPRVEVNRTYRWKVKRQGKKIEWQIDGKPFLTYDDPNPLEGDGHAYLGFNNWESDLVFDNLKITPL